MKKSDYFSKEEILRLAQSPAGQQLLQLLSSEHSQAMNQVHESAGDLQQAQKALSGFLSDPRAQALLRQLTEDSHG